MTAATLFPVQAEAPSGASAPRVVGIDLSLCSTGLSNGEWCDTVYTTGARADSLDLRRLRLDRITAAVMDYARGAHLAVIEGPSYRSIGGSAHDRSGLWWMVVNRLYRAEIPVAVAVPGSRAKYATGDGRADKKAVQAAVKRTYPQAKASNDNEADAVVLAAMGLDWLGHPLAPVRPAQRATLVKVAWPVMLS